LLSTILHYSPSPHTITFAFSTFALAERLFKGRIIIIDSLLHATRAVVAVASHGDDGRLAPTSDRDSSCLNLKPLQAQAE
jgi:hypothetical protein